VGFAVEFSSSISGRRGSSGSLPASGRGELCVSLNTTSSIAAGEVVVVATGGSGVRETICYLRGLEYCEEQQAGEAAQMVVLIEDVAVTKNFGNWKSRLP
jgi:hypothetical protein